jgi:hypothetical protein
MPKRFLILSIILLLFLLMALIWAGIFVSRKFNPGLESFAQCLNEKGAIMYGIKWCSWCQKEKANFKDAWRFINYVECLEDTQRCLGAGVNSFPTWTLPGGKKLIGYQGLEKLSEESDCSLP